MSSEHLEAARVLLAGLGIRPEDLVKAATPGQVPTFADYIPRVEKAVPAGSLRTYSPYWRRIREVWGDRTLDAPTVLELRELVEQTRQQALVRKNSRGGRSAAEHMVAALRCLYRFAEDDGHLPPSGNPGLRLKKPRRLPSPRTSLSSQHLAQIAAAVSNSGPDPVLDILIIRLHLETACRVGSALALRPSDLDPTHCLVRLFGKNGTIHWQPISPTLMQALMDHRARGANENPESPLLRRSTGRRITRRYYDRLWQRVSKQVPWVEIQQVSTHWLRHTTLTWVERSFGYAVARAFAAHAAPSGISGTTLLYSKATQEEVATALSAMTGEPHPLASTRETPQTRQPRAF